MPREVRMTNLQVYDLLSINNTKTIALLKKEMVPFNEFIQNVEKWFEKAKIAVRNNDIDGVKFEKASEFLPLKEVTNIIEETPSSQRPKRNASKKAIENIAQQANLNLNQKLRRPTNAKIKEEKLSICPEEENRIEESLSVIAEIKKEITDMPAPTRPAPKTKKNRGFKIKEENEKKDTKRNTRSKKQSDVIIEEIKTEIIVVSDSDTDEPDIGIQNEKTTKKKRNRSLNEDEVLSDVDNRQKRSRSGSGAEGDGNFLVLGDKPVNATFIATNSVADSVINSTVILEKPTVLENIPDDLMTDDESHDEIMKSPPKLANKLAKPMKQVFSAFEQSPVKKKVEAFEKLHEEATTTRTTRTKTRAQTKQEKQEVDTTCSALPTQEPTNTVKEKVKLFTPIVSKVLPLATSTQIKASRVINNSTLDSTKLTNSALKASQSEFKERERRRKEKEEEAKKKRDALLQAQMEDKKRKREEKQLKAQKQRELLEQEKQKQIEAQRLKEERTNKLLAEQEARKQKIREENEKKRLAAKLLAAEKKKEEERQLEELKRQEEKKHQGQEAKALKQPTMIKEKPIYMRTRAPLLPTDDCYDSDDENYTDSSCPKWAEPAQLEHQQKIALAIGEKIKNTFFTIQAQTADLEDLFEVIEPVKLKRSSSACWAKPPRFTMMPPLLDKHHEFSEDDSD